jgi:hypothetical protein
LFSFSLLYIAKLNWFLELSGIFSS